MPNNRIIDIIGCYIFSDKSLSFQFKLESQHAYYFNLGSLQIPVLFWAPLKLPHPSEELGAAASDHSIHLVCSMLSKYVFDVPKYITIK